MLAPEVTLPEALTHAIEIARAGEIRETALLLHDDALLRNGVAVWPLVTIAPRADTDPPEDDDPLWRDVVIDVAQLAKLLAIEELDAARLVARLTTLRLVYPDGSVHALAAALLRARMRDLLAGYAPRGSKGNKLAAA